MDSRYFNRSKDIFLKNVTTLGRGALLLVSLLGRPSNQNHLVFGDLWHEWLCLKCPDSRGDFSTMESMVGRVYKLCLELTSFYDQLRNLGRFTPLCGFTYGEQLRKSLPRDKENALTFISITCASANSKKRILESAQCLWLALGFSFLDFPIHMFYYCGQAKSIP